MGRKKRLIIPVFIPFGGCPHQCVFCDQKSITGYSGLPSLEDVAATIESYLSTWKGEGRREVAFYGGSFTGLPEEAQKRYLEAAYNFISDGRLHSIRVSTRPDYISENVIDHLKGYGVDTIELGVQSMSDEVLRLSGRNHSVKDTIIASNLIRGSGISLGVQFMPGLPGDTTGSIIDTAENVIRLRPDFVRVYPALVLKDTPLYRMYLSDIYRPWALEEMALVCRTVLEMFKKAGIPVIRMGLQPTRELEENLVAGPYHPSFRDIVEGRSLKPATGPSL